MRERSKSGADAGETEPASNNNCRDLVLFVDSNHCANTICSLHINHYALADVIVHALQIDFPIDWQTRSLFKLPYGTPFYRFMQPPLRGIKYGGIGQY